MLLTKKEAAEAAIPAMIDPFQTVDPVQAVADPVQAVADPVQAVIDPAVEGNRGKIISQE